MQMKALEKMYIVLCALFSVLMVICHLTYKKYVYFPMPFYTFEISVGLLVYPLMFMLTDLIAEFYDKKRATFCVRLAIAMNIVTSLTVSGMDMLQATPWSKVDNALFHKIFGAYGLAFIANMIACYIAQLVDINLYLWIKKITKGKWLWLRNNGSTVISLFIDTMIGVNFYALLGIFPREHLWFLIISSYSFKFFTTIFCCTPLFYLLVGIVKRFILPKNKLPLTPELQLNTT